MSKIIDLTGQTFGLLTVTDRASNDRHGHSRWVCRCVCGGTATALGLQLRNGHRRSCGCLKAARRSPNGPQRVTRLIHREAATWPQEERPPRRQTGAA